MSTRDVEALVDELIEFAKLVQSREYGSEWRLDDANRLLADARARLLALLAPEPEPSDADDWETCLADAERTLVKLAGFPNELFERDSHRFNAMFDRMDAAMEQAAARAARQTGGEA